MRISACAEIRFRGRYWGQSGHELVRCICLLMTQSGHDALDANCPSAIKFNKLG